MVTPNDVPVSKFIPRLAKYLKENVEAITPPTWAILAKTGTHVQQQPQNPDWWYVRCASILRKIYVHGPIGIEKLRANYGGRSSKGVKPKHATKSGGSVIRKALQQLQNAGFVEILKAHGRRVTPAGRKILKEVAEQLIKDLSKETPELQKYQEGE